MMPTFYNMYMQGANLIPLVYRSVPMMYMYNVQQKTLKSYTIDMTIRSSLFFDLIL